ncbi:MAG: NAD-binding protein [Porticoccus sp.]|nr:NAD-binding protein [Porticoccus sp.]
MRVVLIGASGLGMATVAKMLEAGHEVVVVDKDKEIIEELDGKFDCSFYCGDGAKPSVLKEVDPGHTDLLLCLSDDDTANILAAVVAKSLDFGHVVLRLEDTDLLSICEQLGLENVIVPDQRVARELLRYLDEGDKPPT